jgi:hypothetical protein
MKFFNNKSAIIALFLGYIKADQPVHCVREKLYGQWEFHVGSEAQTVNLFETKEICGHLVPNKV